MDSQPLPPPRLQSAPPTPGNRVTFQGASSWRESLLAGGGLLSALTLLVSLSLLVLFAFKGGALLEELLDYLDKTVAISKINYSPLLGIFSLNDTELSVLDQHKTYKTLLSCFAFSDLILLFLFAVALFLYFSTDVATGTAHVIFYIVLGAALLLSILEVHSLVFFLLPYSSKMPGAAEELLNHAIPHNPGGLQQMENRLSCTFDHNLYAATKRTLNPKNTCDPRIVSCFIPRGVLFFLLGLRLLPMVCLLLLAVKRTPLSEAAAQGIEKLKCSSAAPIKRNNTAYQSDFGKQKRTTIGGTKESKKESILPPTPTPGQIDHNISYNNAAYVVTAQGLNSSRSSEISRIDAMDLYKATHHASGSIMSEV